MAWGKQRKGQGWQVVVTGGPDVGWHHRVDDEPVYIGRAPANDIVLTEPEISREHLMVYWHRGAIRCEDLGSTQGSYYWSRWRRRFKLRPRPLRPNTSSRRRAKPWRTGGYLLLGPHTLELIPDWRVATKKRMKLPAEMLARFALPLVMGVAMIPLYARAGSGRMLIAVLFPLMMVAMAWATWRTWRQRKKQEQAGQELDPAEISPAPLIAMSRRNPAPKIRAWDSGNAVTGIHDISPLTPGSSLAVVGEGALSFARWILCQWAVFSGLEEWSFHHRFAELPAELWLEQLPHHGNQHAQLLDATTARYAPPTTGTTSLIICSQISEVPPWCGNVIQVNRHHNRQISPRFAEYLAQELSHRDQALALPTEVPFSIPPPQDPAASSTSITANTLEVNIGAGPTGPALIDLVAQGPHALVAGTTGSGKSEFLTSWILSICAQYPPEEVGLVLIDYKGGATFGALEPLPHCLGMVTDLSAGLTARVLASLHAELRRRERALAAVGARNIQEAPELGRLVIAVDEFRILATEHPDFLESLVRLAAQGRSLGMHLILATQRPGGIVQADVQANISLRICFQVRDESDSLDVIGSYEAARLPAVPGRGIISAEEAFTFQSAFVGSHTPAVVQHIAATWQGHHPLPRPWAEPLPHVMPYQEMPRLTATASPGGSAFAPAGTELMGSDPAVSDPVGSGQLVAGVIDDPHHQVIRPWIVPPLTALILQGTTGLSNSCSVIAHAGLAAGMQVAVVTQDSQWPLRDRMHTYLTPTQPETVCFFVDHLLARALPSPPQLLIIDDADVLISQLDHISPGYGITLLRSLIEARRRLGYSVVIASKAHGNRLAEWADMRLVLSPQDATAAQFAGIERDLAAGPFVPGRGVLMAGGAQFIAQVPYLAPDTAAAALAHQGQEQQMRTLPQVVRMGHDLGDMARDVLPSVKLGVGVHPQDPPVSWQLEHTMVIIGTRGSGRSTALQLMEQELTKNGYRLWRSVEEALASDHYDAHEPPQGHDPPGFLLLDDLSAHSARSWEIPAHLGVIAAAGPELLAHPFPGLATRLAEAKTFLFLGNPAHATAISNEPVQEYLPRHPTPGRGVLVQNRKRLPIQVFYHGNKLSEN